MFELFVNGCKVHPISPGVGLSAKLVALSGRPYTCSKPGKEMSSDMA